MRVSHPSSQRTTGLCMCVGKFRNNMEPLLPLLPWTRVPLPESHGKLQRSNVWAKNGVFPLALLSLRPYLHH
jgi:hypothetical protein